MTTMNAHTEHADELRGYMTLRKERCPHCRRSWEAMGLSPDWSSRETIAAPDTQAAIEHLRDCVAALEAKA